MRIRALGFTLLAACVAIGATACGGSDPETSDASGAAVEQIEVICGDWQKALGERGDFPVDGFDPQNPAPADLPAVGDFFAAGHEASDEAIARLRALSPPAAIEDDVEQLVSALEQQLEQARTQASAAQAGDVDAFTATLDGAISSQEAVKQAAEELGVPGCAF